MIFTSLGNGHIEKIAGKENSRYTINDVWFDAENGRLAATNGHALAITHVRAEAGDVTGLIPAAAMQFYRQQVAIKGSVVTMKATAEAVVIENITDQLVKKYPRPSGMFANYSAVIPQVEGPPTICLSINLLNDLVAAIGRPDNYGQKSTSEMIAIWVQPPVEVEEGKRQEQRALLVKTSETGALGIIMPMRSQEDKWVTTLEGLDEVLNPKPAQIVAIDEEDDSEDAADPQETEEVAAVPEVAEVTQGAEVIQIDTARAA